MNRKRSSRVASSSRFKRAKLETLDPFERLPVELHELFLKNLNGNDVMALSEVSTTCYANTAASKPCMSKIRLAVLEQYLERSRKNLSEKSLESILDTTRKYSAVKLSVFSRGNFCRIVPFLAAVSDSIVELELNRIHRFPFSLMGLNFPKLRSLTLLGNDSVFNENLLFAIAYVPLEKLKLDCLVLTKFIMDYLTKKSSTLRELTVNSSGISDPDFVSMCTFLINLNIEKLRVNHILEYSIPIQSHSIE